MDEEKKEVKPEKEEVSKDKTETTSSEDAGDKYETTPVIERAREEREKLELATKAMKIENDRQEKIMARKALCGETEAGTESKPKYTDEEKAARKRIGDIGRASGASWAKDY